VTISIVNVAKLPTKEVINKYKNELSKTTKNIFGHVARMGETMNSYRVLVGKAKRKEPLGRPRCG
jgi:hypothetical protein